MAKTLKHKLVYRPREVSEFYDLTKDPRELTNLWNSSDLDAAALSAKKELLGGLLTWFVETSDTTDWQVKTGRGAAKMPPGRPLVPTNGQRAPGDTRPNL